MSTKSIGRQLVESKAWSRVMPGRGADGASVDLPDFDVKALFSTTAGFAPMAEREAPVAITSRVPRLLDLLTSSPTKGGTVPYMEETAETSNAAEAAEGGLYGEAAFTFTPRSADVRKIAVWLPVTDEVIEDDEQAAAFVDERLPFLLRQRLEAQALSGNGTAPNLRGILNTAGVQTQALGTDSRAIALRKAVTKVWTPGEAIPNALVINPLDAEDMDLAAAVDQLAAFADTSRVWNLPRVQSTGIAAGTALVGDFANFVALKVRRGITLTVTNSHSTYFTEGKQAIRADIRAALPVYRPAAFCTVTGL